MNDAAGVPITNLLSDGDAAAAAPTTPMPAGIVTSLDDAATSVARAAAATSAWAVIDDAGWINELRRKQQRQHLAMIPPRARDRLGSLPHPTSRHFQLHEVRRRLSVSPPTRGARKEAPHAAGIISGDVAAATTTTTTTSATCSSSLSARATPSPPSPPRMPQAYVASTRGLSSYTLSKPFSLFPPRYVGSRPGERQRRREKLALARKARLDAAMERDREHARVREKASAAAAAADSAATATGAIGDASSSSALSPPTALASPSSFAPAALLRSQLDFLSAHAVSSLSTSTKLQTADAASPPPPLTCGATSDADASDPQQQQHFTSSRRFDMAPAAAAAVMAQSPHHLRLFPSEFTAAELADLMHVDFAQRLDRRAKARAHGWESSSCESDGDYDAGGGVGVSADGEGVFVADGADDDERASVAAARVALLAADAARHAAAVRAASAALGGRSVTPVELRAAPVVGRAEEHAPSSASTSLVAVIIGSVDNASAVAATSTAAQQQHHDADVDDMLHDWNHYHPVDLNVANAARPWDPRLMHLILGAADAAEARKLTLLERGAEQQPQHHDFRLGIGSAARSHAAASEATDFAFETM